MRLQKPKRPATKEHRGVMSLVLFCCYWGELEGLIWAERELLVWVMCEHPSNSTCNAVHVIADHAQRLRSVDAEICFSPCISLIDLHPFRVAHSCGTSA